MAYEASLRHKMEWDGAIAYATEEAVRKERELAEKEIEMLKAKVTKAEAEKLNTARSIKEMGILTSQQIAEKFNLPLEVVEGL